MSFAENNNVSTRMNMSSWHTYHERNNLSKFHVNLFSFRATLAGFFFTGLRSVVIFLKMLLNRCSEREQMFTVNVITSTFSLSHILSSDRKSLEVSTFEKNSLNIDLKNAEMEIVLK